MKIGIDCRLWGETGVGRYTRNLIENLVRLDNSNNYTLFVRSADYENIKYQISNIKKNWKLRLADTRWHSLEEQIRLPQILNRENLDLMHFTYFSVPVFYNKPFVVTIHDLIINHFPTGQASALPFPIYNLKLFGYKFVINQAVKKSKKIITVSNATKQKIIKNFKIPQDKIEVTYEGIDDKIRNEIPARLRPRADSLAGLNTKYFLYVGNAYPHKNLERLLQAIFLVRKIKKDIKLLLVGKDDYFYKRLRKIVKDMGLQDEVVFVGEVDDFELSSLYKNAKALIMPSLMEGFGLPLLEAMRHKCLVLASDIPPFHEIGGDAIQYFKPKNIQDIAEKITDVFTHDKSYYSKQKEIGFTRSHDFSWEKMAKETLAVYEQAAFNS